MNIKKGIKTNILVNVAFTKFLLTKHNADQRIGAQHLLFLS